jgi:hypothetical protein
MTSLVKNALAGRFYQLAGFIGGMFVNCTPFFDQYGQILPHLAARGARLKGHPGILFQGKECPFYMQTLVHFLTFRLIASQV